MLQCPMSHVSGPCDWVRLARECGGKRWVIEMVLHQKKNEHTPALGLIQIIYVKQHYCNKKKKGYIFSLSQLTIN